MKMGVFVLIFKLVTPGGRASFDPRGGLQGDARYQI